MRIVAPYVAGVGRAVDALQPDAMPLALFPAAEQLRDSPATPSPAAPAFAANARRAPASVIAPKALLAQAVLEPDLADSLVALVRTRYPTSVYTLALSGSAGDAYRVLEDSLQRVIREELQQQRRRGRDRRAIRH